MPRYWVYLDSKVQGPVEIPALRKISGFTLLTQVCAEGEQAWRMADEVIEIKSYFLAPPRPGAVTVELGNTLAVQELEPSTSSNQSPEAIKLSVIETLPDKQAAVQRPAVGAQVNDPVLPAAATVPGTIGLRVSCVICGYKNPRDVVDCMKCGSSLKAASALDPKADRKEDIELAAPKTDISSLVAASAPAAKPRSAPVEEEAKSSVPTIEIPVTRIALITIGLGTAVGLSLVGYRVWKQAHRKNIVAAAPAPALAPLHPASSAARRTVRRATSPRRTSVVGRPLVNAAILPGLSKDAPVRHSVTRTVKPAPVVEEEAAPYRVINEAAPLKKRESSPIDSPFAQKRRANKALWEGQEGQAIQIVQKYRIYGGQRTIQRNTDILMQILRDREYASAFESGKRPYLYNDIDWSASPKEGPLYEVRMTFSGGKEADGSVRKPLRFAFDIDLERGTVQPGGEGQIEANTMHAFFDESRIPPEQRRPIVIDTEALVQAAQPGASPLTLDAVARQFVATYTTSAMQRVADAYNLDLVQKKLKYDTRLTPSATPEAGSVAAALARENKTVKVGTPSEATASVSSVLPEAGSASRQKPKAASASGSAVEFQMDRGQGQERRIAIRLVSRASPARLWEVFTGYDRLKQFVPDMLTSQREGQDGNAVIVNSVSLSHFLFFVFKVNLHLRIIEHPAQYTLDFERIAGEFESFRGSMEILTDPVTKLSVLNFRATMVPKGRAMDWVLRDATRRFLVPLFEAVRSQAEG